MNRNVLLFAGMFGLLAIVGFGQSWSVALTIFNLCLISSIMALGVNIQWGYAGLFNIGIMGFAALGGVAAVLVSKPPVSAAWSAGGAGIGLAIISFGITIAATIYARRKLNGNLRNLVTFAIIIVGFFVTRGIFDPSVSAIEKIEPAKTGYLGGLGLPIILSWAVGGVFAAGAAWLVGKIALGLRSDYLAIATLGISEIIIAVLKNEDWLTRGVKNVAGLDRPVAREINLQNSDWFISLADTIGANVVSFSSIFVKLSYSVLFAIVLMGILWLSEKALKSPWRSEERRVGKECRSRWSPDY